MVVSAIEALALQGHSDLLAIIGAIAPIVFLIVIALVAISSARELFQMGSGDSVFSSLRERDNQEARHDANCRDVNNKMSSVFADWEREQTSRFR